MILLLWPLWVQAADSSPPAGERREPAEGAEVAQGQSMSWWTTDGGGGVSASGPYRLSATMAQPDTGTLAASGFTLSGGYWAANGAQQEPPLFANGFESGDTSGWSQTVPPTARNGAVIEPEGGE